MVFRWWMNGCCCCGCRSALNLGLQKSPRPTADERTDIGGYWGCACNVYCEVGNHLQQQHCCRSRLSVSLSLSFPLFPSLSLSSLSLFRFPSPSPGQLPTAHTQAGRLCRSIQHRHIARPCVLSYSTPPPAAPTLAAVETAEAASAEALKRSRVELGEELAESALGPASRTHPRANIVIVVIVCAMCNSLQRIAFSTSASPLECYCYQHCRRHLPPTSRSPKGGGGESSNQTSWYQFISLRSSVPFPPSPVFVFVLYRPSLVTLLTTTSSPPTQTSRINQASLIIVIIFLMIIISQLVAKMWPVSSSDSYICRHFHRWAAYLANSGANDHHHRHRHFFYRWCSSTAAFSGGITADLL